MSALHQVAQLVQTDLSGGQVDGEHPTQLADNQFESFLNMYGVGKKARGRPGLEKITTVASGANLNSVRTYRLTGSNWEGLTSYLMIGTQIGFGYYNGTGTLVGITSALPSSNNPWHMRQYKDVMYAVRAETLRTDSVLRRVTLTGASVAGIASPTPALTTVTNATGVIPVGVYKYVYTYRNSTTGAESNPSAGVRTHTLAATGSIDISGIGTSANAQVDQRRIWRSLMDQSGIYYLAGTINDNTTTTYNDNTAQDALGDAASYLNAEPPVGLVALEEWNERLWMAGESNVFYSRLLFPESWPATNVIQVGPDDGQFIRALLADGKGKRLLVGKSGSIHEITGVANSNFRLEIVSRHHGVAGSHAMATAEGIVFFFSGENVYAIAPGGRDPQSISTVAIRTILDAIPDDQLKNVRLGVYAPLSWLTMLVATAGTTTHQKMLVYNYRTGAWYVFTFAAGAFGGQSPCFVVEASDTNFAPVLYAVVDHSSYRFLYKFTDAVFTDGNGTSNGANIAAQAMTRGYAANGRFICINDVGILGRIETPASPGPPPFSVSVKAYVDGVVYGTTKTLILQDVPGASVVSDWKRTNLSTLQKPGTFVQMHVECNFAVSRPEISGLSLNCVVMNRRRKVA